MRLPGFFVYDDQMVILISALSYEQIGKIMVAQYKYSKNGEITDFSSDGKMQMAFEVVKNKTDLFQASSKLKSEQQRLRALKSKKRDSETEGLIDYLLTQSKRYKNADEFRADFSNEYKRLNELLTGQVRETGYELPTDFEPDFIPPENEDDGMYVPSSEEQEEVMRSYHEGLHEGIAGIIKRF